MVNVEQIYLMVNDLQTSRLFYEQGLELTPVRVGETTVTYATEGCELKLQEDFEPEVLEEYNLSPPRSDHDRGEGAIFVLTLEGNLHTLHLHLKNYLENIEGSLITSPRNVSWGGEMFIVQDPNGYLFEIRDDPV